MRQALYLPPHQMSVTCQITDFSKVRWACEHPGSSSNLLSADRLGAEGKAGKRAAVTSSISARSKESLCISHQDSLL